MWWFTATHVPSRPSIVTLKWPENGNSYLHYATLGSNVQAPPFERSFKLVDHDSGSSPYLYRQYKFAALEGLYLLTFKRVFTASAFPADLNVLASTCRQTASKTYYLIGPIAVQLCSLCGPLLSGHFDSTMTHT